MSNEGIIMLMVLVPIASVLIAVPILLWCLARASQEDYEVRRQAIRGIKEDTGKITEIVSGVGKLEATFMELGQALEPLAGKSQRDKKEQ